WERMLGEPAEAISVLKEMLEQRPDNLRALRMLSTLYRDQQMWQALAENTRSELDLVEEAQKNQVKNRLAVVCEHHLLEVDRAVDLYEEVLDDEPTNAEAMAGLEAMMEKPGAPAGRASRI